MILECNVEVKRVSPISKSQTNESMTPLTTNKKTYYWIDSELIIKHMPDILHKQSVQ